MKWEYKVIGNWEDWDKYGLEGWELVTVRTDGKGKTLGYFKREIK